MCCLKSILLFYVFIGCCQSKCAWQCKNGACDVDKDGSRKCSQGCLSGLTGKYCQEFCPTNCKTCEQFGIMCTSCKNGFKGEICNETDQSLPSSNTTDQEVEFQHSTPVCKGGSCGATTTTPMPSSNTPYKASAATSNIFLIVGIVLTLILFVVGIVVSVSYRMIKLRRRKRSNSDHRHSGQYHSYDYIGDAGLASYYSSLHRLGSTKRN